ncbi:MAG: DUF5666 domain-containing protein [Solirubrobacterales bacterium]
MLAIARKQLRSIAMLAVAAALVVGGVAAAQSSSDSGSSNGKPALHAGAPPGGPAMGIAMKGLTYGVLHVQNDDGDAETIRIDQGKVKSVGSGSLTLTENDGSEVTVTVDDDTQILGKPGIETSLEDLEVGQQVSVSGPEGGTAKAIMVLPKKGDVVGAFHGGPMPPPGAPGIEYGVQSSTQRGPSTQSSGSGE